MSKMFPFITKTWNPVAGECLHGCAYCWATRLAGRYGMQKYNGVSRLQRGELKSVKFSTDDFVFVQDMSDLFGDWICASYIKEVLGKIRSEPAKFLLLTKNPKRYLEFELPDNVVAGATIENDVDFKVSKLAPSPFERVEVMRKVNHKKMVSIEPVMDFTHGFPYAIVSIKPEFVAVGYDNYRNHLPEPSMSKTLGLIEILEEHKIKVYRKTIRESWEKNHEFK